MSTDTVEEHRAASRVDQPTTSAAALTAMGIVYGDLGTSPLYTLQAVAQTFDGGLSPSAALGSLSLIFWLLIITVSIKYCLFVMRADNHGEGGILALMLLTRASWHGRGRVLVIMGLFGAALIYGDGIITPAISVLSALEGLNQATEIFKPHVMPMAVVVLLALFAVQSRGTARIGKAFGPVMLVWFATIAVLGVGGILHRPGVLAAVNPAHALGFLLENPRIGVLVLGAAFLAITGAEALYADMGHIGRNPIRTVWYCVVLPALLLNYAGQTALYLDDPALTGNPFFRLVPQWAIYPMVLLATLATIIASQAIITGTFSMTRQAVQLGWFPGLRIRQTSDQEYGQIYVPFVNWTMMAFTIALTIGFTSSNRLAGAYGPRCPPRCYSRRPCSTASCASAGAGGRPRRSRSAASSSWSISRCSPRTSLRFATAAGSRSPSAPWFSRRWRLGATGWMRCRRVTPRRACHPKYSSRSYANSKSRGSQAPRSS